MTYGDGAQFLMICGYAIITLIFVYFNFPETLSHERRVAYSLKSSFNTYKEISKQPRFYLPCLSLWSVIFADLLLCHSLPIYFMVTFGYSSTQFGVLSSIIEASYCWGCIIR